MPPALIELGTSLWPWPWPVLPFAVLVALGAGAVRGFAGFGFSALAVAGLAPFVPVGPVVAAALALEAVASAAVARSASADVDRRWLTSLLTGNALFIPLGLAALAYLPATPVRLLVGAALLGGAVSMRLADGHRLAPNAALRAAAGVASGLLNGLAASGGVAAAMLMIATRPAPAALRATMIVFLLYVSGYALAWAAALSWLGSPASTLLGVDALRWIAVLAPAMLLGIRAGRRAFGGAHPDRYRRFVLNLLIAVSGIGLLNASLTWLRAAG